MSYTPFLKPHRRKDIDGVYRHKDRRTLLLLKNIWIKGFVDCRTERSYNGYQGIMQFEDQAEIKKCIIECDNLHNNYVKVFSFYERT